MHGAFLPESANFRFAAALSSPKHVDGFQKLVTVSDIQRLKVSSMKTSLDGLETLVADSWQICNSEEMAGKERAFGKLCVRAVLHVMGKEKFGVEKKTYSNLSEIACASADELQGVAAAAQQTSEKKASTVVTNVLAQKPCEVALRMLNLYCLIAYLFIHERTYQSSI